MLAHWRPAGWGIIGVSCLAVAAAASSGVSASTERVRNRFETAILSAAEAPPVIDTNSHSGSGTWTDLKNVLPFKEGADTALLMTDGTVLEHDACTTQWYRLTPDRKGGYETGTWSTPAAMPIGDAPLFFASEILPDGRLIVNGGEYNTSCSDQVWTNKGAIYDPVKNKWATVSPPFGWARIGDAPSVILPVGNYMLANCCNSSEAIATISGTTVTWSTTGGGKADSNGEEGWTLLPDGSVMTVDANRDLGANPNDVEIYDASSGTWSGAGTTAQELVDPPTHEIGPPILRPDGKLIWFGAVGHNDAYDSSTGAWIAAPDFPVINGRQFDCADTPAVLLPSGNVLVQAGPGVNDTPSHFFEFSIGRKGVMKLTQVDDPAHAIAANPELGRFVELPTGQVLWASGGEFSGLSEVATYTPKGSPHNAWLPKITSVAATLAIGSTGNPISGKKFNGFSQGASYGDDVQMSSNYPLVRITNDATGDICFGRSYNFSTMGVWTKGTTNAAFDLPASCETGASTLQVVVNGLASPDIAVTLNN